MNKQDTSPGLLSKMVKFVRNPTTNWSDLDQAAADRDDAVSKQLLKEMVERKRRNDFVRKREFDMLRKMRKREALVGTGQDPGGRPSFFQSSMPSKPDDRASTLKKIDEIEAQMSMQWWKTKNAGSQENGARPPAPQDFSGTAANGTGGEQGFPRAYSPTEPAHLQSAAPSPARPTPAAVETAPDRTKPAPLRAASSSPSSSSPAPLTARAAVPAPVAMPPAGVGSAPPAAKPASGANKVSSFGSSPASDFSSSKFTIDGGAVFTHDAELEEAAILFANGDDQGAEAGLLEILGPGGSRHHHAETWLTLFDLYRASGQQDKFELAALQFVERFNRSAPQWFSMPDIVRQMTPPAGKADKGPAADWICPSAIGIQTVAALKAAMAKAQSPCCLDWTNVKSIDSSAVDPLYQVFSAWAVQPLQIGFIGDAQLQKVLKDSTPSGSRATAQNWWQLRMQALRVTNQPDEFELAALDFCVTYEVSPPSWESARCQYKSFNSAGKAAAADTIIGDVYRDSAASSLLLLDIDSQVDSQMSLLPASTQVLAVELAGTIQGDAIEVLDQLGEKLVGADMMLISCAKLIRVDFSAAGTLLNWVSARQAENRLVHFSDVNRLVAAFFNVIGISEHARVATRVD